MTEMTPDDLDTVARWHFAVGGLKTQSESMELAGAVRLERLKTFPTRTELTSHLNSPLVAGLMQHYGEDVVQHELVIDAAETDDPQFIPRLAGLILAGLRIRTGAEILCPAVCDRSWSDLRRADPNSCLAYRVEPAMYAHKFEGLTVVTADDLGWVRDNLNGLLGLEDELRFRTALEALCTYLHAANYRMMAAQLWAGIEALFDVTYEISFRLPLLAALLLEKRGPICRDRRLAIHELYKQRSKAVHGGKISEEDLKEHVSKTRQLLAQLLSKIVTRGSLPTSDEFTDLTVMP